MNSTICVSILSSVFIYVYLISYRHSVFRACSERDTPRTQVNHEYNMSRLRGEINMCGQWHRIQSTQKMVQWQRASCSKCYLTRDSDGDMSRKLILSCWTTKGVSFNQINVSKILLKIRIAWLPFQAPLIGSFKHISIVQTKLVKFTTLRCGTQLKNASNIADITHQFHIETHRPSGHARNLTEFSNFSDVDPHSTIPTLKDFHTLSTLNSELVSVVEK
jgi:hypothetical protein